MVERSADQYSQCEKLNIPMLDLGLQYQTIKAELIPAIEAILESGVYINGPPVFEFEQIIAHFLGVKNALGVASGTDALLLALHVLGIKPGDQVVVPAFTF
ncbi:MAG: aminotransferase class I/II-fold pyridoxal phosphate-dependent enzyme, partial [Syntrophomonadaceae bacterium]|nr:aminotransferase class I/II-fold pyridoxal phosphate-dependent enzyme [Syntrophomonadaceae bacterium]